MWQTKKIPIQYLESLCNHQGYISQCSLEDRPCWITHSPLSCLSHSSPAARWICAVVIFFWKCHFIGGRGGHRHRSILQLIPPVHTSVYLSSVSLWLNEHLISTHADSVFSWYQKCVAKNQKLSCPFLLPKWMHGSHGLSGRSQDSWQEA